MATGPKILYEFGPFWVDPDKRVLLHENQPVAITPKAFETLLVLVRHSREDVSKEQLMQAVWPDAFVETARRLGDGSVGRSRCSVWRRARLHVCG